MSNPGEYSIANSIKISSNTIGIINGFLQNNEDKTKLYVYIYGGTGIVWDNMNIFDLTQMFGAGNEPSTVEQFKSMFPLDYYPL